MSEVDKDGEASKATVSVEDFKSLESWIDILATLLQSLVDAKKDPPKPPPQEDLDSTLPGFFKALEKPTEEKSEDNDSGSCRRGEQTDAMGWLELGPMDAGGIRGGKMR